MKKSTFFSIGLLISFFLPWINLTIFSLNGYEIPLSLDKVSGVAKLFDGGDKSDILKISYFLYLIPLCSILSIIKDISGNSIFFSVNEFMLGIIGTSGFFLYLHSINEKAPSYLGVGFYSTVLFSIVGGISYYHNDNKSEKKSIVEIKNPSTTLTLEDKNIILNQLSQLHSLNEKGVLPDDVYEKERLELLQKINNGSEINEPSLSENYESNSIPIDEPAIIEKPKTAEEIAKENAELERQKIKDNEYKKKESLVVKIIGGIVIVFVILRIIQAMMK